MFDTTLNLWLQSWSAPGLTMFMNIVSLLGYSHACIAFAAIVAYGWTRRAGVALVVIVALTAGLTDIAKATWRAPRPESVDARVQHLSFWQLRPGPDSASEADAEDRFGFPSGHVAGTTALAFGIASVARRRWTWIAAGVWIAVMAASRMYLGRHFLGDVLGGFAMGAISLAIGHHLFRRLSWLLGVAAIAVAAALLAGLPPAYDAGRLAGIALAAAALARTERLDARPAVIGRILSSLLAIAILGLATAWDFLPYLKDSATTATPATRLMLSALLNGAAVIVPAWMVPARHSS
jgi:membrane-associated phospholipid phosphatase